MMVNIFYVNLKTIIIYFILILFLLFIEFLLGEKVLIAPVIESNSVERDIYLPKGIWKDANTNENITGPIWLRDYPAPLNILPYFYKL